MEVIRTGGKAFPHQVQWPWQAGTHGTAEPPQREARALQEFNHEALRFRMEMGCGRGLTLALTGFTSHVQGARLNYPIFAQAGTPAMV
jgi:hypothetical protein